MAQLLPRTPTLGSMLAQGLGGGIGAGVSSGLDALLKSKMQQLVNQQQARQLSPLYEALGVSPEMAYEAPQVRAQAVKSAMQTKDLEDLKRLLVGGSPEVPAVAPTKIHAEVPSPVEGAPAQPTPETAPQKRFTPEEEQLILSARDPRQLHETMRDIYKTREKTEVGRRTETRKYREKMLDRWEDLKKEEVRLRKMQKLSESDKLDHPLMVQFMDKLGLKFLLSPESAEYEKTAADLLRRIIVGTKGRVSEMVVREFIKSLPSLVINPEGRKRIEETLLALNQMEQLYPQTMVDILNQYKGKPHPVDLQMMVNEQVDPKLEPLIKAIEEGMQPVTTAPISLPPPTQYKEGDVLRNKKTGKTDYILTAGSWKKV